MPQTAVLMEGQKRSGMDRLELPDFASRIHRVKPTRTKVDRIGSPRKQPPTGSVVGFGKRQEGH